MNNKDFLEMIKGSFMTYLGVGTSRSNAKLKQLHGSIAVDLKSKLGPGFVIKSQGYGDDKEGKIDGKYYPKNVDITIFNNQVAVAGFAVKFVMRNYSQNSNNYFENMLGETANIRSNSIPYFQIFIIFDKVPYYKKGGEFQKYDVITEHNIDKYVKISNDDVNKNYHTPDKTLFVLVHLKEKSFDYQFINDADYNSYYKSVIYDKDLLMYSNAINDNFGQNVIYNDYENFIDRTVHIILGKLK